jgi:hypothetical protein
MSNPCPVVPLFAPKPTPPRASWRVRLRCLWSGHSLKGGPGALEWRRDERGWPLRCSCARRCGYWFPEGHEGAYWVGAPLEWIGYVVVGAGFGTIPGLLLVALWHGPVAGAALGVLWVVLFGGRPHFTEG